MFEHRIQSLRVTAGTNEKSIGEDIMDLVQRMRDTGARPGDARRDARRDAILLIATVCNDRPWTDLAFRAENGITEFYILLDLCVGGDVAKTVDVGATCNELARTQRNYIVHNEQILLSLSRMLLKLKTMRDSGMEMDATTVEALRGTLRETILPFCLFMYENVCANAIAGIHSVLSDVVFVTETNVLHQWPEWRTDKKEGDDGAVGEKTCPITLDPIVDGIIASDGYLYERTALLKHMIDKRESPMTREFLDLDFVTFTNEN